MRNRAGATGVTLQIRDEETDRLVRRLAASRGVGLTEAVRLAVANELARGAASVSLQDRLAPLQARVRGAPPTGLAADKAFYDGLDEER